MAQKSLFILSCIQYIYIYIYIYTHNVRNTIIKEKMNVVRSFLDDI